MPERLLEQFAKLWPRKGSLGSNPSLSTIDDAVSDAVNDAANDAANKHH